ncbi:MAG: DUF3000 domain-containing protein [Nocardioidaceae bacterium]
MATRQELGGPHVEFVRAVQQLRDAPARPEVVCEQMPAPSRIAPHAYAMSGDVVISGEDVGTGRIVLLHDPDGNDAWQGTFRLVTFARADVEVEMVTDPMLPEVGWSWLTDALTGHDARHIAASGSVTTVRSEGFGGMREDGSTAQLEIRASWTPVGDAGSLDLGRHVGAWSDLLCEISGLPPLAAGVVAMPNRRGGLARGQHR